MELGREMFECPVLPLGDILAPLAKEEWYWVETKGGVANMAEDETPQPEAEGSSYLILPGEGDPGPTVAVGEPLSGIVGQMTELADLLREFGGNASRSATMHSDPDERQMLNDANKALLRAVERIMVFVNEYE